MYEVNCLCMDNVVAEAAGVRPLGLTCGAYLQRPVLQLVGLAS